MGTSRAADDLPDSRVLDYQQAGPTAVRMLVGGQLRRLREARGISRDHAGETIRASASKISRMELGRTSFKQRDVADLLTLYGVVEKAERQAMLGLARQATRPGWWREYHDVVPPWFEGYLGLELAAHVIRTYEVQFIPGLLQIEDYARAVIRLSHYHETSARLQRRVRLRMHRQHILTQPHPPQMWAVIDEAALRRPVGGVDIQHAQLRRLIEVSEFPHVTVQAMAFDAGGHAAAGGPITLLRFPEDDLHDVVYLEQLASAIYVDRPTDVTHYRKVMNQLSMQAEPPAATRALLRRILDEI